MFQAEGTVEAERYGPSTQGVWNGRSQARNQK